MESQIFSIGQLPEDQVSTPHAESTVHLGIGNGRLERTDRSIISRALRLLLNRHPKLRRLLYEFRSFLQRSRIAVSNTDIYQVSTGFEYLETEEGHDYLNIRSHARIQHIQKISSIPWATPIDWKTHLDSWDQGVEWAIRTFGSGSSLPDEHKALLAAELSYKRPTLLS